MRKTKTMFAVAAALALGAATMSGTAMAAPHGMGHPGGMSPGGMGHPGGFSHPGNFATGHPGGTGPGGFSHPGSFAMGRPSGHAGSRSFAFGNSGRPDFRFDHHHHGRFFGPGFGLYAFGGPYYDYDDAYDDGCWVRRRVWTPYGWRWRLVDVCY